MENKENNPHAAVAVRRSKIRKRKIITLVIVVLVAALITVFVIGKLRHKEEDSNGIVTAKVERGTITKSVTATGSVTAQTGAQVKIGSQITGRIKYLYADVGTKVKAGDVIAELDLPDVKAQLAQSKANLQAAEVRLAQQESGVGLQQTNTESEIIQAKSAVSSADAAYKQAVKTAELQVGTAEASVKQANANAINARLYLSRQKELYEKGYVAAQDVDNAQAQADVAEAQLDTARKNLDLTRSTTETNVKTAQNALANANAALESANAGTVQNEIKGQQVAEARAAVAQAKAQVQYQEAQYAKTVIRSPIAGTVLSMSVQQGETIAAGLSAPTLIRVTDLNKLQVNVFVDETDIGGISIGQPAFITVDAYPNKKFRGNVTKIAAGATLQQNIVTYDTAISIDNREGLLMPDMTATATIDISVHKDVLVVPIEAVKFGNNGDKTVNIMEGSEVVPQKVKTGISDDNNTEIIEGLKEGDTIVLAGYGTDDDMERRRARMSPFGPASNTRSSGGSRNSGGSSRNGGEGGRSRGN